MFKKGFKNKKEHCYLKKLKKNLSSVSYVGTYKNTIKLNTQCAPSILTQTFKHYSMFDIFFLTEKKFPLRKTFCNTAKIYFFKPYKIYSCKINIKQKKKVNKTKNEYQLNSFKKNKLYVTVTMQIG